MMENDIIERGAYIMFQMGAVGVVAAISLGYIIWHNVVNSKTQNQNASAQNKILAELSASMQMTREALISVQRTSENTSQALSIIQSSLVRNYDDMQRHDKRSEFIANDVKRMVTLLEMALKNK